MRISLLMSTSLQVEIPIGHEKYEVEQNISFFAPSFDIKDTSGKIIYRLEGKIIVRKY
jgi:uncharacterized protein YxjI